MSWFGLARWLFVFKFSVNHSNPPSICAWTKEKAAEQITSLAALVGLAWRLFWLLLSSFFLQANILLENVKTSRHVSH